MAHFRFAENGWVPPGPTETLIEARMPWALEHVASYYLRVDLIPFPALRGRHAVLYRKGKNGAPEPVRDAKTGRVITRNHKDPRYETNADRLAAVVNANRSRLPAVPPKHPVAVDAMFVFPRTVELLRQSKKTGKYRYGTGRLPYVNKPDRDNADKAVLDVLKSTAVLSDDCQITLGVIGKAYAAIRETPAIHFWILDAGENPLLPLDWGYDPSFDVEPAP